MSLEETILEYQSLLAQIKILEEKKHTAYKEILASFPEKEKRVDSENFSVTQYTRFTIKTSIEDAREFGATKTEEMVDKDKIKELIQQGLFIPNVTEARYFFIRPKLEDKL